MMRVADSRTTLERGLPPFTCGDSLPITSAVMTRQRLHDTKTNGAGQHGTSFTYRRFMKRVADSRTLFPPFTFGDSLPITSAVMTIHMAMTD